MDIEYKENVIKTVSDYIETLPENNMDTTGNLMHQFFPELQESEVMLLHKSLIDEINSRGTVELVYKSNHKNKTLSYGAPCNQVFVLKRKNIKKHSITKKKAIVEALDQNGDGELSIIDVIVLSLKTPGIHIKREAFLRKELSSIFPQNIIEKAIADTPAKAGIAPQVIDKLADDAINFERNCVAGIAAALGAPGGLAMAATLPADLLQYYGYMLRASQKLLYLYGFPEIIVDEEGLELDDSTINTLVICLAVMNGAAGANGAIKGIAKAFASGVEKKLMRAALTKGAIYPLIKRFLTWFGIKLTKEVFAKGIAHAIPIAGGIVAGGLTFATFKPCCEHLVKVLKDTSLSNLSHVSSIQENQIYESIISGEVVDFIPEDAEKVDLEVQKV